jgi:hypothetical protein
MAEDITRRSIQAVRQRKDELIVLAIVYEEADVGDAVGQVFSRPAERAKTAGGKPRQILSTNDTLGCLWVSPTGSIWVASADGNVGTTAAITWPAPTAGVVYESLVRSQNWNVTSLPPLKSKGTPPNITALWGTGDDDVHAGTYGGHLYRWDGKAWTQLFEGAGQSVTIGAFGGNGATDVYAVGTDNTIMHFDGSQWTPLRLPGSSGDRFTFTGVHSLSTGDVLISGSGNEGILLQGRAPFLTEFGRYPHQLIDMAGAADRVLFATDHGVGELLGHGIQIIKSTIPTAKIAAGIGRWFIIEPTQKNPNFIEYDPAEAAKPWVRFTY